MAGKIYNSVTWPESADHNHVASYNAAGEATAPKLCYIISSSAGSPAHLVGTNGGTFSYCSIKDMHVTTAGTAWDADDGTNTDATGNEGWTWPAAGGAMLLLVGDTLGGNASSMMG